MDQSKQVHYTKTTYLPWISRMICRFLFHSYRGVINKHGVLQWIVCLRCGDKRDLISEQWCSR